MNTRIIFVILGTSKPHVRNDPVEDFMSLFYNKNKTTQNKIKNRTSFVEMRHSKVDHEYVYETDSQEQSKLLLMKKF